MKTIWLYSYDGDNNDGDNNDGDTFAWTSNIQLISKVYLKKHTSMGRTYTLNKQDYKMVNDTMKKNVEAFVGFGW